MKPEEKVYRCDQCRKTVIHEDIQKGGCICGCRRVVIATSITDDEVEDLKGRGYNFDKRHWYTEAEAKQERGMERKVP